MEIFVRFERLSKGLWRANALYKGFKGIGETLPEAFKDLCEKLVREGTLEKSDLVED